MDALVSVCSCDTNGITVWAWMLSSAYALGTRTELCFGHGCSDQCLLLGHERNYGLGTDALVSICSWDTNGIMVWAWVLWSAYALGTRTELWFGHGCSGQCMLLGHERNYGLVSVCSWDTNGIMVWSAYVLGTRTELWFAHGCSGATENLNQNSSRPRTHGAAPKNSNQNSSRCWTHGARPGKILLTPSPQLLTPLDSWGAFGFGFLSR